MSTSEIKINPVLIEAVKEVIEREVKSVIEKEYEKQKETLLKNLDREKASSLASISLYIMKQIRFEMMQENIVITLRTEDVPKK